MRIFIAYPQERRPFVPLLAELLELHGHEPAYSQADPDRAGELQGKVMGALRAADAMLIVVGDGSSGSRGAARQLSLFRALRSERPVVPLLLDRVQPEAVMPELSQLPAIDFSSCQLDGFRELFATLGNEFLSRRDLANRRTSDERRSGEDRRRASPHQRMFVGFMLRYCRETGTDALDRLPLDTTELGKILHAVLSEAEKYDYADGDTGEALDAEKVLGDAIVRVRRAIGEGEAADVVRVFQMLADDICGAYQVTMRDRRDQTERRDLDAGAGSTVGATSPEPDPAP